MTAPQHPAERDHGPADRREVELGFMFDHSLLSETSRQTLDASTWAVAVGELLVERGLLDEESLRQRRQEVERALTNRIEERGLGLFVNDGAEDKYQIVSPPGINCAERISLCRAACCTYRFPLSRQDVEEGIAQWHFGQPYWNRVDERGYCVHHEQERGICSIYQNRPAPCRSFDCRNDRRIWLDFDAMVVNPELERRLEELARVRRGRAPSTEQTPEP
jgi:Putative zinc- or iron-chelating domain